MNNWMTLDNTAKIMPPTTTKINTNVFRLAVTLKDNINEDILKYALDKTILEYPLLKYTLKDGMFWNYLEKTNIKAYVHEEKEYPCDKINNGLLYRLTYYKKRINFEVYHALSDGNGAMEIFKYLITVYLNKKYNLKEEIISKASINEKVRDDFKKFDKSKFKITTTNNKRAYKFNFKKKDNIHMDVIEASFNADKVKKLANKYNTTVTVLLTSILIDSIIKNAPVKKLNRPIGITCPIDLRNIFPSKTSRNFFFTMCIQYKYKENYTLEDIIKHVKHKFNYYLTKERLQETLNTNMFFQNRLLIRIFPKVIKDIVLQFIGNAAKTHETMGLSNLGVIKMPDIYKNYIKSFSPMMNTEGLQLTISTFNNVLTLCFTSHYINKEIERNMIYTLKELTNSKVKLISNIGDTND